MKKDLSIIIPFAGEYPQAIFTIQAIAQSLIGKLDFEIIAVNNMCSELTNQWDNLKVKSLRKANNRTFSKEVVSDIIDMLPPQMNDRAGEAIKASAKGNEWLTYMEFKDRLSHWECKRLACKQAKADTFLFIDAHCIPSLGIDEMYRSYHSPVQTSNGYENFDYSEMGTMHMPLTYKILEWHRLIYKMAIDNEFYGYSFTPFREPNAYNDPYEVPVMSTCGMMISRAVYECVGGWPKGMYAYGGGENFMNYALSVTGKRKWIYPGVTCHHHGDRRDYHYTYDGTLINRLLAHYLFGGFDKLRKLASVSKGDPDAVKSFVHQILSSEVHKVHRDIIKENANYDLDIWADKWRD